MAEEMPFFDDGQTLAGYAVSVGRPLSQIRHEARQGIIPTWEDRSIGRGRITSAKAVAWVQHRRAAAAVEDSLLGKPKAKPKGKR